MAPFILLIFACWASLCLCAKSTDWQKTSVTIRDPELHAKLEKRETLQEFFLPTSEVHFHDLACLTADDAISMTTRTFRHKYHSYINLERFEPLLHSQDDLCSEAYDENDCSAHLVLRFRDARHYTAAKEAWKDRADLLFLLEHESCFEGRDTRSVYKPWAIHFNGNATTVTIDARPLSAHLTTSYSGFATGYSLRQHERPADVVFERRQKPDLTRRGSVEHFFAHLKDIIKDLGEGIVRFFKEGKIDWDWTHDFGTVNWEPRHTLLERNNKVLDPMSVGGIPSLTCVGCHTKGKFKSEIFFDFDLENVSEDEIRTSLTETATACQKEGVPECQSEKRSNDDVVANFERKLNVQRAARRSYKSPRALNKRSVFGKMKNFIKGVFHEAKKLIRNIGQKAEAVMDHPSDVIEDLKDDVKEAVKEIITFPKKVYHHVVRLDDDEGGWLDFDGVFVMLIRNHMSAAYWTTEVLEDIDLALQLEVASTLAMQLTGGIDYYPPDAVIPFFGFEIDVNGAKTKFDIDGDKMLKKDWQGIARDFPKNKGSNPRQKLKMDADGTQHYSYKKKQKPWAHPAKPYAKNGFGIYPIEFCPFSLQAQIGIRASGTLMFPGISVKIPKGQYITFDIRNKDMLKNTLNPVIEILQANISIEDPQVYLNIMGGPKTSAALGHNFMQNLPSNWNPTVAIGGRIDVLRLDLTVGEMHGVDSECSPVEESATNSTRVSARDVIGWNNTEQDIHARDTKSFGITGIFRTGIYAYLHAWAFVLDTDWIGQLDEKPEGKRGLYRSKQLFGHCVQCNGHCPTDFLNKAFDKVLGVFGGGVHLGGVWNGEGTRPWQEDAQTDPDAEHERQLEEARQHNEHKADEYTNGGEYIPDGNDRALLHQQKWNEGESTTTTTVTDYAQPETSDPVRTTLLAAPYHYDGGPTVTLRPIGGRSPSTAPFAAEDAQRLAAELALDYASAASTTDLSTSAHTTGISSTRSMSGSFYTSHTRAVE